MPKPQTRTRPTPTPPTPTSTRVAPARAPRPTLASTADRHVLYQHAVQNTESELDFVADTFKRLRGRLPLSLREDFCGTGNTACAWAARKPSNTAIGLDIDQPTLDWAAQHNLARLTPAQRARVRLINRDVLHPGDAVGTDCVLAMNFSYWLFKTRDTLRGYFRSVHDSLAPGGVFFLDHYGGYESMQELTEPRAIEPDDATPPFTYLWAQERYNPITAEMRCSISFKFADRSRLDRAFVYDWRLWTMPEVRELLAEAGFGGVTTYWEGDELDDDNEPTGEGNGVFTPSTEGSADPAFVCYLTAEKSPVPSPAREPSAPRGARR
jgi:SAM-dependent methyltransferase